MLSYEQQVACPHNQNLVAIFGKENLQIEGTGAPPTDVVVDAQYQKLNAIRADRANGFYLRNLTAQKTTFNAVYILETDGFVIDNAIGRWNDEYGFLTFADDHGIYVDCEAYGNGDSGVYPGAAATSTRTAATTSPGTPSRSATATRTTTRSATAAPPATRYGRTTTGSPRTAPASPPTAAFPDHPGMPQNHAKFERNDIGDNNADYYRYVRDGTCAKPPAERGYEQGVVCPAVGIPTGTGILNPGGNYNIWRDNWIYGHTYAGTSPPGCRASSATTPSWSAQFDTSHENRVYGNRMGVSPTGEKRANRIDVWWDGQGRNNCWQERPPRSEPAVLPRCGAGGAPAGPGPDRYIAEPGKVLKLYECNDYNLEEARIPGNCDWFGASGLERVEVQAALIEAVLLVALAALVWWRRATGRVGLAGLAAIVGRGRLGVFGTAAEGSPLTGIALCVLGAGWIVLGRAVRERGARVFGGFTVALGRGRPGQRDRPLAVDAAVDPGAAVVDPHPAGTHLAAVGAGPRDRCAGPPRPGGTRRQPGRGGRSRRLTPSALP